MKRVEGKFVVEEGGSRLDVFLRNLHPGLSRKIVQMAIKKGLVLINGKRAFKGITLFPGDIVEVNGIPVAGTIRPEKDDELKLRVLAESKYFVAVEKPAGMPVNPLVWDEKGTVANFVVSKYPEVFEVGKKGLEGGMLNRLDVPVSGFVLCARSQEFYGRFLRWQEGGKVKKVFVAVVEGEFPGKMQINVPIFFLKGREKKVYTSIPPGFRAKVRNAYSAETSVIPLEYNKGMTLVRIEVPKAVRHQIRAHLAHVGHPVVGDPVYGRKGGERTLLHLLEMHFPDFETERNRVTVKTELPLWARFKGIKHS